MTRDEAQLLISIAESGLRQAEMQAATTKLFLGWLNTLETRLDSHRKIAALPDSAEKQAIADQLAAIEQQAAENRTALMKPAQDALARLESDHERIEHVLAVLRASLSKPPGME